MIRRTTGSKMFTNKMRRRQQRSVKYKFTFLEKQIGSIRKKPKRFAESCKKTRFLGYVRVLLL